MTLKLCSFAAALALAVGTTAATFAQAQSTMSKDTATAAPPSADRKVKNAEEDRIEADAKAAKAKCATMKDNAKDVCEKEAKGKEKVAKAELNAKNNPTPSNQRKVAEAKVGGLAEGVAFIPGPAFSPTGRFTDALRLCFASTAPDRIHEGIARLRRAADKLMP